MRTERGRGLVPWLVGGLLLVGLLATVIPAPFTVDDVHYLVSVLALREGRLTVPGTDGLPPVAEIAAFDPQRGYRQLDRTPVAPTVPPLYAFLALPFSFGGWRALVALNVLAYGALAVLTWALARRHSRWPWAPWLAVTMVVAGSYFTEYAQGLWPHALSAALVLAAVGCADRAAGRSAVLGWAALAGLLAGLATGVRYQNVVVAAAIGLGLLLTARSRWRAGLGVGLGLALPLAAATVLNGLRLGLWNPITKGPGYLQPTTGGLAGSRWLDALTTAWFRIVDFGARPPLDTERLRWLELDAASSMYTVAGVAKKAWAQSSPWVLVGVAAAVVVWWPGRGVASPGRAAARRLGLVVVSVLAAFAAAGSGPFDGLGFNQRYFLELIPLVTILVAWESERILTAARPAVVGAAVGLLVVATVLAWRAGMGSPLGVDRWFPVGLGATLLGGWAWARWPWTSGFGAASARWAGAAFAGLLAGSVLWAGWIHHTEDLPASRALRSHHEMVMQGLRDLLPSEPVAVFTVGAPEAVVALALEADVVAIDLEPDGGVAAPRVLRALRAQGRRCFVLEPVPAEVLETAFRGHTLRYRGTVVGPLWEILPATGPRS